MKTFNNHRTNARAGASLGSITEPLPAPHPGTPLDPREVANKILEAKSRIAELDRMQEELTKRRKRLTDWLARQNVKSLDLGLDPALKASDYSEAFSIRWRVYSSLTGRQVGKKAAYKRFSKIPVSKHQELDKAIRSYGSSKEVKRGFSKHFVHFLSDDYWPAWVNVAPAAMDEDDKKSAAQAAREVLNAR